MGILKDPIEGDSRLVYALPDPRLCQRALIRLRLLDFNRFVALLILVWVLILLIVPIHVLLLINHLILILFLILILLLIIK